VSLYPTAISESELMTVANAADKIEAAPKNLDR
jgi:hypothetical protein